MAPVDGATVEAFRLLDTGAARGFSPPSTATTAPDGSFSVDIGSYTGPVLLAATGGSFFDEATGNPRSLPSATPLGGVAIAVAGTTNANLTPITHFVTAAARTLCADPETDAAQAIANATIMVEDYFGITGALTTVPADLTAGAVAPGAAADHGAVLAGISQLANDQGAGADPMGFLDLLARDGVDGVFDGRERGSISLSTSDVGGEQLKLAVRAFLDTNARNLSGLASTDTGVDEAIDGHIDSGGPLPTTSRFAWPPHIRTIDVGGGGTAGGTTMTIVADGVESTGSYQVLFGGVAGVVTVTGDEFLVVDSPAAANAGVVDLRIVDQSLGLAGGARNGFEYFVPGTPSIQRLCPAYGPIAGGTLIEIYGSRLDASSEVRVDGVVAEIVHRDVPDLVVARAPAHAAGTVQVTVTSGSATSNPASFEFRDRDVGQNLTDASVAGVYRTYGLFHDHGVSSGEFSVRSATLTFNGAGTITFARSARVTSTSDRTGADVNDAGTWAYSVMPDGTLWIDRNPGATSESEFEFLRTWLHDDADVFVGARVESAFETELVIGVRRASGMRTSDLNGTWWLGGFVHQYDGPAAERTVETLFGVAEFDGAGFGSAAVFPTSRSTGDPGYARSLDFTTFSYSVSSDGSLTITLEDGTTIRGSVNGRSDFAAGTMQDADGALGLVALVPRGFGMPNTLGEGSWYGGDYGHGFDGPAADDHLYYSDRDRELAATDGVTLSEELLNETQDTEPEGGALETHAVSVNLLSPSGGMVEMRSPLQVIGAVSGTRRFAVVVPTYPVGTSPPTFQDDQMLGCFVRNCAHYSHKSVAPAYNTVDLQHVYESPGVPPQPAETLVNARGELAVDANTNSVVDGFLFLASGRAINAGGPVKIVGRLLNGGADTDQGFDDGFTGGYAIWGDGRIVVFDEEGSVPTGFAPSSVTGSAPPFLRVGQASPHADALLLRSVTADNQPISATTILTRKTTVAPSVSGAYHAGGICLGFDLVGSPPVGFASAGRGTYTFDDPSAGQFTAALDSVENREDGGGSSGSEPPFGGTFSVDTDGRVTVTESGSTPLEGIATPDGSAVVLVDNSVNSAEVCLLMLVRQPAGVAPTYGSVAFLAFNQFYNDTTTFPPAAEAGTSTADGELNGSNGALGIASGIRENTDNAPRVEGGFFHGLSVTVATDGGLDVGATTGLPVLRGGMSADGRYALLVPGVPIPDDTLAIFIVRR